MKSWSIAIFKEFGKFIREVFQDTDGAYSSKRVTVHIAMVLVVITVIANLFWALTPAEFIYESLIWIVLGGLGIASITERGIPRLFERTPPPPPPSQDTPQRGE